ncbi:hypothetical protein TcWFU_009577 [Taenia crassiceps]|uniref:Uncharacterized protein n=1 Tax=Taenia crassiceps TaxID=6207 RepID=A0ABR4Q1B5_9CEST
MVGTIAAENDCRVDEEAIQKTVDDTNDLQFCIRSNQHHEREVLVVTSSPSGLQEESDDIGPHEPENQSKPSIPDTDAYASRNNKF